VTQPGATDDRAERVDAGASLDPAWSAWFHAMFERADVAHALLDSTGALVALNQAGADMFGVDAATVVGASLGRITPSDDGPGLIASWHDLAAGRTSRLTGERSLRRADGSRFWASGTVTSLRDVDGTFLGVTATLVDVTAEHEHHVASVVATARTRALAEHASDLMLVHDDDGTVVHVASSGARTLGWSIDELEGVSFPSLVHPEERTVLARELAKLGSDRRQVVRTLRARARWGAWRWVEITITDLRDDPAVLGYVVNGRDVHDRFTAVEALRLSERRFRALAQHSADVITVSDTSGRIQWMSSATGPVFGRDPESRVGRDAMGSIHPDDAQWFGEAVRRELRNPEASQPLVHRVIHEGGEVRWVETTVTSMLDEPAVAGIVATTRDITDRVVAEHALAESEARVRAIVDQTSDAVVVVGPDLRAVWASASAAEVLGIDAGAVIGRRLTHPARAHPADAGALGTAWAEMLEGGVGASTSLVVRRARPDGHWWWVRTTYANRIDDVVGGIVISHHETTEATVEARLADTVLAAARALSARDRDAGRASLDALVERAGATLGTAPGTAPAELVVLRPAAGGPVAVAGRPPDAATATRLLAAARPTDGGAADHAQGDAAAPATVAVDGATWWVVPAGEPAEGAALAARVAAVDASPDALERRVLSTLATMAGAALAVTARSAA
jgi:PAS domain S-box-containing protein